MDEGATTAMVGGCHALKGGPVRVCGRVRLRARRTRLRWYSYWKTPVMYQQRAHSRLGWRPNAKKCNRITRYF